MEAPRDPSEQSYISPKEAMDIYDELEAGLDGITDPTDSLSGQNEQNLNTESDRPKIMSAAELQLLGGKTIKFMLYNSDSLGYSPQITVFFSEKEGEVDRQTGFAHVKRNFFDPDRPQFKGAKTEDWLKALKELEIIAEAFRLFQREQPQTS
jgi:hypothetical protein